MKALLRITLIALFLVTQSVLASQNYNVIMINTFEPLVNYSINIETTKIHSCFTQLTPPKFSLPSKPNPVSVFNIIGDNGGSCQNKEKFIKWKVSLNTETLSPCELTFRMISHSSIENPVIIWDWAVETAGQCHVTMAKCGGKDCLNKRVAVGLEPQLPIVEIVMNKSH
ncbi:hypothetical protein ID852_03495 [Xenorhabdus sp. 42]|uniref:hypothetical protein n=1 Tax=Xenorhabdus szentirmaii TaxID=290112 RepID=UPI0019BEAF3D|nr:MULTISPECIES: hypothetical protein [unclassified Xenorhabdus]MBD2780836.1 hypothetical protein [Xenorhabdus sp. 38]MBD2819771.1 hypothetical protein [Xenorhabdus sp. 42]